MIMVQPGNAADRYASADFLVSGTLGAESKITIGRSI